MVCVQAGPFVDVHVRGEGEHEGLPIAIVMVRALPSDGAVISEDGAPRIADGNDDGRGVAAVCEERFERDSVSHG